MIPDSILHYNIEKKLGEGGMGEVFLATDTKLDRKVAIKLLSSDRATDPESRQRFIHEAKAEAMLSHPNIVTFHEVGEAEGQAFIVMEYVEGESLPDYVQSQKLSVTQILDLVIQAGEGLQAAHEKGVIHRDIKPENIMVTPKGHVKITDFGLARWKGATTITKTGTRMGTAFYMSPEQAEGRRLDRRSDIFSLGVVLYELLCKQRPFEGESEAVVLYEILNTEPQPLARFCRDVPKDMERIVSKCLAKNPDERYQHADELVADLKHQKRALETGIGGEPSASPRERTKRRTGVIVSASVVVFAVVALLVFKPWRIVLEPTQEAEAGYKMLAVLPFENLGSEDDEYFADGITDEITSRLARISALRVISRTSAMKYKNTDKTIPQIGEELGVDYILEGTILWDKSGDTDRVRITPQLIKVEDDFHVWADNIERPLTQLFAVQADIATHITEALNVTLLEQEHSAVEAMPTQSTEAHDYYMLGRSYADRSYDSTDIGIAIEMFEKAIAIDSTFALGYAQLSKALSYTYFLHSANDQVLQRAKAAIDRALELAPDDPLVRESLARYYYLGHRDYERALEELAFAQRLMPDDPEIIGSIGYIKRRQGNWNEAVEYLEQSAKLNPRSATLAHEIAYTHGLLLRYGLAQDWYERAITLSPDWPYPYNYMSELFLKRDGTDVTARAVLETASESVDAEELATGWALCEIFTRNYAGALTRLPADGYLMTRGLVYYLMNDTIKSNACYDSARMLLEQRGPDGLNWAGQRESGLGVAYAHLRRAEDAVRLGRQAMDMLPPWKDATNGWTSLEAMAHIYIVLGDQARAIDLLEQLLSIPSDLSVPFLQGHPLYDSLRDHPRFQALLKKGHKVF